MSEPHSPEYLWWIKSIQQAIQIMTDFNGIHFPGLITSQVTSLVRWLSIPGSQILATNIDDLSSNQNLLNNLNYVLENCWLLVQIVSIWSIRTMWLTQDVFKIIPMIKDGGKFEDWLSQNLKDSSGITWFIVNCIIQFWIQVKIDYSDNKFESIEIRHELIDLVSQINDLDTIPKDFSQIISSYRQWDLRSYLLWEQYFSHRLSDIVKKFKYSVDGNQYYDISVIRSYFEDCIAVLQWLSINSSDRVFEYYKSIFVEWFCQFASIVSKKDSSYEYILDKKSLPEWIKVTIEASALLVLWREIAVVFPELLDPGKILPRIHQKLKYH